MWVSSAAGCFSSLWQQRRERRDVRLQFSLAALRLTAPALVCRDRLQMSGRWRCCTHQVNLPSLQERLRSCRFTTSEKQGLDVLLFVCSSYLNRWTLENRGLADEEVQSDPFLLKVTPQARSVTGSSALTCFPSNARGGPATRVMEHSVRALGGKDASAVRTNDQVGVRKSIRHQRTLR